MRNPIILAAGALAAAATPWPANVSAQSREVVQALPSENIAELNRALQRLATNPQSVDALLSAGTASLELGDIDAAIGFFGRADELSPGNPRAKLGMAAGFLRSERPVEALRLFTEAERAGVSADRLAGDRGLAYDLVGDNAHAQEEYRKILARRSDPEIARRLALSQAISGDAEGFERTLRPLLEKRDLGAYRARAFGLAILGQAGEAQRIADAVMPQNMARQMAPYLSSMPQLTKAQQAAAANLGRFPRTGLTGGAGARQARSPQSQRSGLRQADAALVPQGPALDAPTSPLRTESRPVTQATAAIADKPPQQALAPIVQAAAAAPVGPDSPASARDQGSQLAATIAAQQPARAVATQGQAETAKPSVSIAFSAFAEATRPTATAQRGAVDITTIAPPRELVPPPPPAHPQRVWVQVATGQDLAALKFDWRRLARSAPDELGKFTPHTVPWGVANRLLAGPFASEGAAQGAVNRLKEKGIDTFSYTSPEGQRISELD